MTTIENNEKSKSYTPINYEKLFETLLRNKRIEEKYGKPYKEKIKNTYDIPEFYFKLEDLRIDELFKLFSEDIDKFLNYFRKFLFNYLNYDKEIAEILKENRIKYEELHIIIDPINYEFKIDRLDNFSENWSRSVNRLINIRAFYMTPGLDKKIHYKEITFFCDFHGGYIPVSYPIGTIIESFETPDGCNEKKCHNKKLRIIKEEPYEIGIFTIGEKEYDDQQLFRTCYIFRNINYFIEKIKKIDIMDEVEILGILRLDHTKFNKKNDLPGYYIDIMDIKSQKINMIDDELVNTIKLKINSDPSYIEKLIDSSVSITFNIDIFYSIKFLIACTFITGGSWRDCRDTLNVLYGGRKGTFKSTCSREFRKKVGNQHFFRTEVGPSMTKAGLFGTTERKANQKTPEIRYGSFALFSNGTLCFDEAQKFNPGYLDTAIRNKENGEYYLQQDGMRILCGDKGSMILSQNFVLNKDGSYCNDKDIYDNLGWSKNNIESRFDRIDLVHIISGVDRYTDFMIRKNRTKMLHGKIEEEIAEILEIDDYNFPKSISSMLEKINYIHYNYFHKAKQIYRKSTHSDVVIEALNVFFEEMSKNCDDMYNSPYDIFSVRTQNVCYKLIRAYSSLKLKDKTDESDFRDFKDKGIPFIYQFKNSELIKKEEIEINQIFRNVFQVQIIENNLNKVDIKELLERIKTTLKRNYFEFLDVNLFEEKIIDYLGSEYDMSNYKLRKLLKNNEDWLRSKGYVISSKRGRSGLTFIEKDKSYNKNKRKIEKREIVFNRGHLVNLLDYSEFKDEKEYQKILQIFDSVKELFKDNKYKEIELKSLIPVLKVNNSQISELFLNKGLNYLMEIDFLIEIHNGFYNINKKWL